MSTHTFTVPNGYADSYARRGNTIKLICDAMAARGLTGAWQIESFTHAGNELHMNLSQTPLFRPQLVNYELGAAFTPTKVEALELQANARGLTIVEIKPALGYALAAALTPAVKTLRNSLAGLLKIYPHQIDLNAFWAPSGQLDAIHVRRFPQMPSEKAESLLREFLTLLLGDERAVRGWAVNVSAMEGVVSLKYGDAPSLPSLVKYADIALGHIDPSQWYRIPVGRNAAGDLVEIDLKAGPHTLVVGGTGSGKSVTARAIMAGAFARGYEVICTDPTKKFAGQKNFIPYTKGFFVKDVEETAEMLDRVYAEVRRRVDLIDAADAENWQDLPAGTIKPWMVVIDEFSGLISVDKKPGGDPKASEAVKEALDEWTAHTSAVAMIQSKVAKIAREARSAGVHLMILTQRPDASDIPGQVREQMGTIIQLVSPKRIPSREALAMVFPGEMAAQANEEIRSLFDGRPGFGLAYIDGASIQGFKASLIEPDEITSYLTGIGVPQGVPLMGAAPVTAVVAAKAAPPEPTWGTSGPAQAAPEPAWAAAPESATPEPAWGKQPAQDLTW